MALSGRNYSFAIVMYPPGNDRGNQGFNLFESYATWSIVVYVAIKC